MTLTTGSQLFFALTMIAVGAMGLISGGFAPIWSGVPQSLPDRQLLAGFCTSISLVCGAGLLAKRTTAPAALMLFVYLSVWTALFKVPSIVRHPLVEGTYQACGENAVLISAAWVLYAGSARTSSFPGNDAGLRIAHLLYGLALVAFGLSHFVYVDMTAPLVPLWLPGHVFWAYFTGALYLAAGIALVTGLFARLGAMLAAVQIMLITLLVWGPVVFAGRISALNWQETVVSWSLTAAAWVVATSFGPPWSFDGLAIRTPLSESLKARS